jgi:hypothetical protein
MIRIYEARGNHNVSTFRGGIMWNGLNCFHQTPVPNHQIPFMIACDVSDMQTHETLVASVPHEVKQCSEKALTQEPGC